tara:strand:- start:24281 stop:25048 length:768 start_codon:yes stop_codon:yes gene_type:complete
LEPDSEAVDESFRRFDHEIDVGTDWYRAVLLAAGAWQLATETYRGRQHTYLIGGEALDLLLVIDRLVSERPAYVPRSERNALRFSGCPPMFVSADEFAHLLGPVRLKAYLNYFYGVAVEEAVIHAVEIESTKAHPLDRKKIDAYRNIYGLSFEELLERFREELNNAEAGRLRWHVFKEFTYWCFKLRIRTQVPARMASDTRKGITLLQRLRNVSADESPDPLRPDAEPYNDADHGVSGPVDVLDVKHSFYNGSNR